jgi:ascorbate-specific PTS system EIIC-type component UlaA
MKSITTVIGILFVIAGILTFAYQGFTYTQQEKIAQIGDVKITADTQKRVHLPPVLGGLSLAAGIILVLIGRKK